MTLLRHTPTGDLYPYNDSLARRDDMVAYTPPPEGAKEEPVAVAKAKAGKQAKKAPVVEEELTDMFGDLTDELDEIG